MRGVGHVKCDETNRVHMIVKKIGNNKTLQVLDANTVQVLRLVDRELQRPLFTDYL